MWTSYFVILIFTQIATCFYTLSRVQLFCRNSMQMSLGNRIRDLILKNYKLSETTRVVQCWDNFIAGNKLERYLDSDKKVLQTADCFVDGLTATSFHETSKFPWISSLEQNYQLVLQELEEYEAKRRGTSVETLRGIGDNEGNLLQRVKPTGEGADGDGEWLGPRDTSGSHYGPEWKTLGLQDRSVWSADLSPSFPRTVRLLTDLQVPSCEVFFAKQGPRSGLKPHSDKNNFIITCHLALDVPEGQCWIKVGDTTHYWKNGKTCIFDTSVIHSTENQSDRTRYVLLIRLWHPELSLTEIDAFKFIFGCLDHAALGADALEEYEVRHFFGQDNHSLLQKAATDLSGPAGREQLQQKGISRGPILSEDEAGMRSRKGVSAVGRRDQKATSSTRPKGKGFGSK